MGTTGLPKNETWHVGSLAGAPNIAFQLGELTTIWAYLEHTFPKVLAKVLGIEEEPAQVILFALNSTAGKIEIIRAVAARTASKQTRTALNAALDKVSSLAKRRNVYIHHMMGVDERGRVCRWDYRETPDTQARRIIVKEKDIVALVVEIKVVHNDLMFAAFPEMGPPPPLRETPLLQHASPKRAVDRSGRISGKGR